MCWLFLFLLNSANCLTRTTVCNWHYPRQIQVPRIHFTEPWTTLEITDSQHNECQQRQKTLGVFLYISVGIGLYCSCQVILYTSLVFYYGLKSLAELAWFLFFGSLLQRLGSLAILEFGSGRFCIWSLRFLPRSLRFRLVINIRVPDANLEVPFSKPRIPTYNQSGRNYCLQLEQNEIHDNSSIN